MDTCAAWSVQDAIQLYGIERWGDGYFTINDKGHVAVSPVKQSGPDLDLTEVVHEARQRGMHFPLLLRFHDLLRHRVASINEAFQTAIRDNNYAGAYRGVFPIKVNQLREVVEEIIDSGKPYHFGLEVGSKPELYAALALHEDQSSLIICNGYKDREFIRTALMGRKLNKEIILVIEKVEELRSILDVADSVGILPYIGIRVRLQTKSSGKWALSGGDNAKFGLSTHDMLEAIELLRSRGKLDCFRLLHFHVGSQVPDILTIKRAVREATRYYAKLKKLGIGSLRYLDIGGGLGVDYDGTRTSSESSVNYTVQEYTQNVISSVADICTEENVPQPDIVSEGGRSIVAHHSILVVEAFGAIEKTKTSQPPDTTDPHKLAQDLNGLVKKLNKRNRREILNQALQIREEAMSRFELGLLELQTKAYIETAFWYIAEQIALMYKGTKNIPQEIAALAPSLGDQFICNFSVFQSLIDHWAVGQLFPIMPVDRLDEKPVHEATLVDITCDSDGKIDKFVDANDWRSTLPLHPIGNEPYLLAFFLMGAYQDVMGDLHNLFGPSNEAHVFLDSDEPSGFYIEEVIPGYSIAQVLDDVQYNTTQLVRQMKQQIDQAIKSDLLKPSEGMKLLDDYAAGLQKPTYLTLLENGHGKPADAH